MCDSDYETELSAETLCALNEFLNTKNESKVSENWQLSQFWYNEKTVKVLEQAINNLDPQKNAKIALISCPTLYEPLVNANFNVNLFEFDERFAKYSTGFIPYDYRHPLNIDPSYHKTFDIIVADPPFLSEECLTKTAQTIRLLQKNDGKIILCTGLVMEELSARLLGVKLVQFQPEHCNNLANEFVCLTNFGEVN